MEEDDWSRDKWKDDWKSWQDTPDDWGKPTRKGRRWASSDRSKDDSGNDDDWDQWENDSGTGTDDHPSGTSPRSRASSDSDQSWQSAYREAGPFLDIGLHLAITMVVAFVLFLGGGSWLDKKFESGPILTIVGAILAFVAVGYRFYSGVVQLTRLESRRKSGSEERPDDAGD